MFCLNCGLWLLLCFFFRGPSFKLQEWGLGGPDEAPRRFNYDHCDLSAAIFTCILCPGDSGAEDMMRCHWDLLPANKS